MLGLFRAVLNTILLCCAVLLHLKLFIPSINSFQYPTNGVSISNAAFKLSFAQGNSRGSCPFSAFFGSPKNDVEG
jgi:hypothetical protein